MSWVIDDDSITQACPNNGQQILGAFISGSPVYPIVWDWRGPGGYQQTVTQSGNVISPAVQPIFPGTYTLVVTDSNGEVHGISTNVIFDPNLDFDLSSNATTCSSSNSLTISNITGVTNRDFVIRVFNSSNILVAATFLNFFQTSYTFANLPNDTYTVGVATKFANREGFTSTGCYKYKSITVQTTGITGVTFTKNDVCGTTIWVRANPVGGTPPYTYSWSGPSAYTSTSPVITGLTVNGTYSCDITDSNGCTLTTNNSTTISQASCTALSTIPVVVQPGCACTGSINLSTNVTGGTGPYTYEWQGGSTASSRTSLCPGTYNWVITDSASHTFSGSTVLNVSSPIVSSYSVVQPTDSTQGSITQNSITGGSSPYTYSWDTGETTASLSDLDAGEYNLTITDSNGTSCQAVYKFTLVKECTNLKMAEFKTLIFNAQCCLARDTNKYLTYLKIGREDLADCLTYKLMAQEMILSKLNRIISPPDEPCLSCSDIQTLIDTLHCLCKCEDCDKRTVQVKYNYNTGNLTPNT